MTPKKFLEELKTAIATFDQLPFTTDSVDESQYQIKKDALLQSADLMLKVESSINPIKIRKQALAAQELLIDPWAFTKDYVPSVAGEKTKKFIKDIYLPFLEKIKTVKVPLIFVPFSAGPLKVIEEIIEDTKMALAKAAECKPTKVSATFYYASPRDRKVTTVSLDEKATVDLPAKTAIVVNTVKRPKV